MRVMRGSAGEGTLGTINGHSKVVGVMGWPVEHTVSPAMHNAAFQTAGLNWCYLPLSVHPDRVGQAVYGLRALGFAGCNVTVPHKQAVMEYLDEITAEAQAIGAVNTILMQIDGRMIGHNTDAAGFLRSLAEHGFRPEGTRAVVMGAGGAARAVAYALASAGTSITILNRTLSRAESLVADLAFLFPTLPLHSRSLTPATLRQEVPTVDLLVNTTSLGMWPQVDRSAWPEDLPLPPSLTVLDLVYNPLETKLIHQAREAGALAIGGLEMLVYQGAAAWELWTGQKAPVEVMVAAAEAAL